MPGPRMFTHLHCGEFDLIPKRLITLINSHAQATGPPNHALACCFRTRKLFTSNLNHSDKFNFRGLIGNMPSTFKSSQEYNQFQHICIENRNNNKNRKYLNIQIWQSFMSSIRLGFWLVICTNSYKGSQCKVTLNSIKSIYFPCQEHCNQ